MNKKLKIGLALFFIGFAGVLTLLTVKIPLDSLPPEVLEKISPEALKYLLLVNPLILLLIAVVIGTLLYDKVGLSVPAISSILNIEQPKIKFIAQIKYGVLYGLISGLCIIVIGVVFKSAIPQELIDIESKLKVTTLARFGYGGLTEEILMRYGLMSLVVWIVYKLSKSLSNLTFWIGIVVASLLFALGHFPIVFQTIENPSISLLTYVLVGNAVAGIFFGWLYWRKGLEAAFVGHVFAHVAMIIGEKML
jgi:membrane protease YdiL (CAAX protease family)